MKIQGSNLASVASPTAKLTRLYPSRYYLWGVSALHLFALLAVTISAIFWWLKLLLALAVLLSACLFAHQWRQQDILRVQYWHQRWCLLVDGHSEPKYILVTWSFWTRWLIIVEVDDAKGRRHRLPLFLDCCTTDEFRWLRVIVKYYL